MSRAPRRRRGLRRKPEGGWPLDNLLVGVGTLRTLRELFQQEPRGQWDRLQPSGKPSRAWDLALWSGVTPTGSADSLKRMLRHGLVRAHPSRRRGRATAYRLDWNHPLVTQLSRLFEAERAMVSRSTPRAPLVRARRKRREARQG